MKSFQAGPVVVESWGANERASISLTVILSKYTRPTPRPAGTELRKKTFIFILVVRRQES